jgi:hypothetical protein
LWYSVKGAFFCHSYLTAENEQQYKAKIKQVSLNQRHTHLETFGNVHLKKEEKKKRKEKKNKEI